MTDTDRLSIALQRAGALSPSHMTYHDLARCLLAALTDGRDDLGSPDEHDRHMAAPLPSDTPADGLDVCDCEPEHVWPCATIPRCDEPGCERETSCGFPTPAGYRRTCGDHYRAALALTQEPRSAREEAE